MNKIIKLILYFLVLPLVMFGGVYLTLEILQLWAIGGYSQGFPFTYYTSGSAMVTNDQGELVRLEQFKPLNLVANFAIYLLFSLLLFYFFEIRKK
ncbi:MAG: hypothetical protein ACMXYF_02105 [Candidatus Woesearchaeota archaeon]